DFENFLPVLEDAVFKPTGEASQPTWPKSVSIEEIDHGLHHADLVKLEAKLLDRTIQQKRRRWFSPPSTNTVLLFQAENVRFTAEAESPESSAALARVPLGSVVEVAGICFTESGEDKKLRFMQMLLPNADSIRVLQKPSWWTPQRLL